MGAEIEIESQLRPELLLFHEGPSRVLISTAHPGRVAEIAARHGVEAPLVGVTIKEEVVVKRRTDEKAGATLIRARVESLRNIFEKALENKLRG